MGTALASVAARAGRDVMLLRANTEAARAHGWRRRRIPKLPGLNFDPASPLRRISPASRGGHHFACAPAQNLREAGSSISAASCHGDAGDRMRQGHRARQHKFMTEVIAEAAPDAVPAILSGPSFASDAGRAGLPTAVTLAAKDESLASALVQGAGLVDLPALSHPRMCAGVRNRRCCEKTCWPFAAGIGSAKQRVRRHKRH